MKRNKTGGRVRGTPNRITSDLRGKINTIIENQIDSIEVDLNALEPKDRLMILEKLLKYALPTLQAQSLDIDFQNLSETQLNQIIDNINLQDNETE